MYMSALDDVLADADVRSALDEFSLSPHTLRGELISEARQVLMSAPQEFAAYEAARTPAAEPAVVRVQPANAAFDDDLRGISLSVAAVAAVLGAAFVVAGVAAWRWTEPLVWAGGSLLLVAGGVWAFRALLGTQPGLRLLRGELIRGTGPELIQSRNRLMTAITRDELLAQARTFINTRRQGQFDHTYSVGSTSGLSGTSDTAYQVPTSAADELEGLLSRLDGASIGVAGPRGSGKSTLIRGYCEDGPDRGVEPVITGWRSLLDAAEQSEQAGGDLRCMVSAPVDYAARDFVLHLFATFCRSVVRRHDHETERPHPVTSIMEWLGTALYVIKVLVRIGALYGLPAAVLLHWGHHVAAVLHLPAQPLFYAGLALIIFGNLKLLRETARTARQGRVKPAEDAGHALAATARLNLARVRYLQTYTSGWSGTMSLPQGTGAQFSRNLSRAEQPLSYPEIVAEFRMFARDVADHLHQSGDRVFIGIDELDKIGAPEGAEQFLNEVKGIFGIPHLYFMVSVSDDALTAFERRGLPLRDAFDSSFDEIIHVGPLSYPESRRLLYRRIIGLSEPYVALCHCLAGGLARDLIRAARLVTRAGEALTGSSPPLMSMEGDFFVDSPGTFLLLRDARPRQPPVLGTVCAAVVRDELRRKIRAVAHVANTSAPGLAHELQASLHEMIQQLTPGAPALGIVDLACRGTASETPEVAQLRFDFAAYTYYCVTLRDVFNASLTTEHMITATRPSSGPGSFDALASARHAFTLDTHLAWRSITAFRQAWSMETRDPTTSRRYSRSHPRWKPAASKRKPR
jgi:hypothetical protein